MRAPPGSRRGGEQAHSLRQRERNRATLYVTGFAVRAHTPTAIACARGRKNDGQGAACRSPHGQELGHWCVRAPRRATPSWLQLVCRSGARARSPAITSTRPRAEYSLSKPGRPPASSLHLCAASRTETAATVPATAPSTNKKVMPAPVPSFLLSSSSFGKFGQPSFPRTFFSGRRKQKKCKATRVSSISVKHQVMSSTRGQRERQATQAAGAQRRGAACEPKQYIVCGACVPAPRPPAREDAPGTRDGAL